MISEGKTFSPLLVTSVDLTSMGLLPKGEVGGVMPLLAVVKQKPLFDLL